MQEETTTFQELAKMLFLKKKGFKSSCVTKKSEMTQAISSTSTERTKCDILSNEHKGSARLSAQTQADSCLEEE